MEIDREAILQKTHRGLTIYAHVLKHYFPGETVLSLSGRDCQPTKNPFNWNKPSLMVRIVNNKAVHYDLEDDSFKGDAFDFAALHFSMSGIELLQTLNKVLGLRIDRQSAYDNEVVITPQIQILQPEKIPAPVFSYYKAPVSNTVPLMEISLLQVFSLIKGNAFEASTKILRGISDRQEARKYKASNFDYVTFSGVFSKRSDASLRSHSGLITLDFDHIPDLSGLKSELLIDQYFETELLFFSPSGDGLKWVISIDLTKATHLEYFKAISNYIEHTYKLEIDQSGKDLSRACFLAQDQNVFINPKYL